MMMFNNIALFGWCLLGFLPGPETFIDAAELPTGTTAWPEICRVMSLYRNCTDVNYRIACGENCNITCIGSALVYVPSKGSCFGAPSDGLNTWTFAQESCKAYGGKIAVLKNQADADYVKYIIEAIGTTFSNILVGGLNIGADNVWFNLDGTENDNTFWANGRPTSTDIQCLISQRNFAYKLGDDNCQNNSPFICEGAVIV